MAQLSFLTYLGGIYKLNLTKSTKVHNAIIQSLYDCFIMARDDLDTARLEMCLTTASGYWLDYWGTFFSVYRKSGELDEHYSKRIIDSVIQPKSTIPSIKDNIVDYLNSTYQSEYTAEDILIREPWTEIAKYSHKGVLSKDARFFSSDYYTHAVLDISIPEEITNDLIDLVNSIKAAGVKIIWSILNQYDIVSGFNDANDAWAAYHRWIKTKTERVHYAGLILSNSSPNPMLSGRQLTWYMVTSLYQWYAVIKGKKTDDSIIITKKDLIGLADYYEKITVDADGNTVEELAKITDDLLETLKILDSYLSLSYQGRMSTKEGVMFEYTAANNLWDCLMKAVDKFKANNPDYYNAVQPPITNGERAMWVVERNKNWLWNTPTMTHQDFYELWEPFGDYEEHTINSIVEFEDAYYNGYITFGDKYQPPMVISKPRYCWAPKEAGNWLWDSPVFLNEDLEQLYLRQFYPMGILENPDPKVEDIMLLEDKYSDWGYSVVGDSQPPFEIVTSPISET